MLPRRNANPAHAARTRVRALTQVQVGACVPVPASTQARRGSAPGRNSAVSDLRTDDLGPWLSPENLELVRRKVPMVYVDVVPVRLDVTGQLQRIGLLLRSGRERGLWRTLISGRVLLHEPLRAAIARHVEKDLGPMALPRLPASPQPFTVTEYMPTAMPGVYSDPRQHAVSLAYVVPIEGDPQVQADTLQLTWLTPGEALDPVVQSECVSGHAALLTGAIAHLGALPAG